MILLGLSDKNVRNFFCNFVFIHNNCIMCIMVERFDITDSEKVNGEDKEACRGG